MGAVHCSSPALHTGTREHPFSLTTKPSLQQSQSLPTRSSTEVEDKIIWLHVQCQHRQERCCIHEVIVEEPQTIWPGNHQFAQQKQMLEEKECKRAVGSEDGDTWKQPLGLAETRAVSQGCLTVQGESV